MPDVSSEQLAGYQDRIAGLQQQLERTKRHAYSGARPKATAEEKHDFSERLSQIKVDRTQALLRATHAADRCVYPAGTKEDPGWIIPKTPSLGGLSKLKTRQARLCQRTGAKWQRISDLLTQILKQEPKISKLQFQIKHYSKALRKKGIKKKNLHKKRVQDTIAREQAARLVAIGLCDSEEEGPDEPDSELDDSDFAEGPGGF